MPNLRHSLSTINPHKALTDSKAKTGRTIDLLYLDACLMGMWEVAHEVHNEVNYLLASESWSWTSFAYGAHLAAIANSRPTADVGAAWISNEAAVMAPIDHAYTYSLLDLSQMPTLTNRIDVLAQQLEPLAQSAEGKAQIRAAFAASDCFDSNGDTLINRKAPDVGKGIDTYCDLCQLCGAGYPLG
ncbi:MAG: clostripain-related cysteine peptidase [Caldilineaceae bacterium]